MESAGDRVLLQPKPRDPFLSKILRPDGRTSTQHGELMHANIIGKRTRDTVMSSRGTELRVFLPTLADYVTLTPRNVTPVYPADANLIVSLLDLHIGPSDAAKNGPPSLEILEAGTGHGSLTLYLARAIHGSNRPHLCEGSAKSPEEAIANETEDKPKEEKLQGMEDDSKPNSRTLYVHQNDQRQAVIHTLDVSPKHSKDARVIVKGFRHGIYRKDIEFHVGDVSEWIDQQIIRRRLDSKDTAFLSHVLLDMPNADRHIQKAASALHVNGSLLAFNPSITQIMAIVETVKRRYLPLQLDRVVELGPNMTGGREWDVRAVLPRALTGAGNEEKVAPVDVASPENTAQYAEDGDSEGDATEPKTRDEEEAQKPKRENRWGMVCRPKVGDRIAGGGFLRVWKKMKW